MNLEKFDRLKKALAHVFDFVKFEDNVSLGQTVEGLDSLDLVELVMALEEEFDCSLDGLEDSIRETMTPIDLYKLIESRI